MNDEVISKQKLYEFLDAALADSMEDCRLSSFRDNKDRPICKKSYTLGKIHVFETLQELLYPSEQEE